MSGLTFVTCAVVLHAVSASPDDVPDVGPLPVTYRVLVDAENARDVVPFTRDWTAARTAAPENTTGAFRAIGGKYGIKDFTFENAIQAHGLRPEVAMYVLNPDDIAKVAVIGDRDQRTQFANEMYFVEVVDRWATERLRGDIQRGLGVVDLWVSTRAAFASDFILKRFALFSNGPKKYHVAVETRNARTHNPEGDYEVMYVLELFENYPKKHEPFPKFSTPTHHGVDAGRYVFYCRRKKAKGEYDEGPHRTLNIAADTPLDLFIP